MPTREQMETKLDEAGWALYHAISRTEGLMDSEWPVDVEGAIALSGKFTEMADMARKIAAELHTLAEVLGEQEDK